MTYSIDEHRQRFELMKKRLPARTRVEVRTVQKILGMSSTSVALKEIQAWHRLGLVEYEEPPKGRRYGTYYLKENHG